MKTQLAESIKKRLKTEALGRVLYLFEEVGSTNEVGSELARNGAPHGTVVISDSQTRGRGRLHRRWISPPDLNLYMSVILRPPIDAKDAPLLTLVASIAVAETIKKLGVDTLIKWPNDVLIGRKKVAGVLTEMQPKGDKVDFTVVGIGVNLNMTKEFMEKEMGEVAEIATSLREATGQEVERLKFASNLINELETWYKRFIEEGKPAIIREWTERWGAVNRRVQVRFGESVIEGIALRVDENGYLVVRRDDGTTETIVAGDVILL